MFAVCLSSGRRNAPLLHVVLSSTPQRRACSAAVLCPREISLDRMNDVVRVISRVDMLDATHMIYDHCEPLNACCKS